MLLIYCLLVVSVLFIYCLLLLHYSHKLYFQNEPNTYDSSFNCLPCAPGCETCDGPSPCVITLNWEQRSVVLGVSALVMCGIPLLIWFTVQYRDVKVSVCIEQIMFIAYKGWRGW